MILGIDQAHPGAVHNPHHRFGLALEREIAVRLFSLGPQPIVAARLRLGGGHQVAAHASEVRRLRQIRAADGPFTRGALQQVRREVREVAAKQRQRGGVRFKVSRCRGPVAKAKLPDNPLDRSRDFRLGLGLRPFG